MVWGDFGAGEDFPILRNEGNCYDLIFFSHLHSALPYHLLPVVQIETLGAGKRGDLEYGNSLGFVAVHELRRVDHLNIIRYYTILCLQNSTNKI